MTIPQQGEIWWAEAADKRRPVLVVTRDAAIGVLHSVLVAPVTRMIRNIPTEVALGRDNGFDVECVASFDNLQPIRRSFLTMRAGRLTTGQHAEICRALAAMSDC